MNIAVFVLVVIYISINVVTAKKMNIQEMQDTFINGQCFVGMVFANVFYSPAWFLKAVRKLVLRTIK